MAVAEQIAPSSAELVYVPPADLSGVWPSIAPLVPSILERSRGRLDMRSFLDAIMSSRTHLFVVWDGTEALSIVGLSVDQAATGRKIGMIRFASGKDSPRWIHLIDLMEDRARDLGCDAIEIVARKGWERKLGAYKLTHVVLEKDLS